MNQNILQLRGCTPEPLGNYLKALGIFRLVTEHADPSARAWWQSGVFHLATSRFNSPENLVSWLYNSCPFTAFLSPWCTNSGWGKSGKREAGGDALLKLLQDKSSRTSRFRLAAQELIRVVSPDISYSRKQVSPRWYSCCWFTPQTGYQVPGQVPAVRKWIDGYKDKQAKIIVFLRNHVQENWAVEWLDTVAGVHTKTDMRSPFHLWFPLLARGGAEGSGNYIVRQQQYLADLFFGDSGEGLAALEASVTGRLVANSVVQNALAGLFFPGFRGDPNIGQMFTVQPRVNRWDFIVLLEGLVLFSSAITRQCGASRGDAAFPFYCDATTGGAASIGLREVPEADKSVSSGEIWCPLWDKPANLSVLRNLFGEGRLQVSGRTVRRASQFAFAVTRYGCDRGINAFLRYGLIRRSGSYGKQDRTVPLAIPLGSYAVTQNDHLVLLEPLLKFDDYLNGSTLNSNRGIALGAGNNHPERLLQARLVFESSFFAAVSRNTIPSQTSDALINVLVALATLVREFSATRGKVRAGRGRNARYPTYPNAPIPKPLKREWMQLECFDYPCEFRLARAVGAMVPWGRLPNESQSNPVVDGIRINLLPLKRGGGEWHWQENSRSAVWARGATLFDNLAAVLRRRLIDAQKAKGAGLPLWSCYGASFSDLLALWQGEVDQQRLTELVFGLSLVDSGIWKNESIDEWQQKHDPTPDLQASAVWFDRNDEPRISLRSLIWHGRPLLAKTDEQAEEELISAFQLPRVYALLKLCFLGGRLPARSMEGQTIRRTRREPYPPPALDVLSLLQAGRLPEAVEVAARKLRARGYPPMINNPKFSSSDLAMPQDECRRLAGLLLIPVRHAGVLAALAIKPCPKTN